MGWRIIITIIIIVLIIIIIIIIITVNRLAAVETDVDRVALLHRQI